MLAFGDHGGKMLTNMIDWPLRDYGHGNVGKQFIFTQAYQSYWQARRRFQHKLCFLEFFGDSACFLCYTTFAVRKITGDLISGVTSAISKNHLSGNLSILQNRQNTQWQQTLIDQGESAALLKQLDRVQLHDPFLLRIKLIGRQVRLGH